VGGCSGPCCDCWQEASRSPQPTSPRPPGETSTRSAQSSALPDTEYDEQGRIAGYGITLRPTPHHFAVDGQQLYTWCALDTLIFPAILDRPATVVSPCHASGLPVRFTVEPNKISSAEPATAVVSIATPDTRSSIRSAFCNQVHFFASPTTAQPWLDQRPDATVVPVAEALALAGPLTQTLLTADGDTGATSDCCAPHHPATRATSPSTEKSLR
jgi:alkylmercury lyase